MDLESECSVFESSVDEDNDVTSVAHFADDIQNPTSNNNNNNNNNNCNGSCAIEEADNSSSGEPNKTNIQSDMKKVQNVGFDQLLNSPPTTTPTEKKGHGLRKWRRIRRDFVSDSCPSTDSSKILKRGLSGSANYTKTLDLSVDARQKSEGSVGSANAVTKNLGGVDYLIQGSSSDSRLAAGSVFAAGTDSENSEDRSSKSSTAASAPKMRYDGPGHARDKTKMKNLSGKGLGYSPQRIQQGKARVETTKKPRGEKIKIEKENSHSSVESDSRSSNFVFTQGGFSVNSNGKQSGKATNYDGENSDEAQASEQQFSEDLQTGYSKENVEEIEDLSEDDLAADMSSWKVKQERSENHRPPTDDDPLVNSILTLHSVQEALEKELQKFLEIGKENSFTSTESEIHPSSSDQLGAENIGQSASCSLKTEVISLTHMVHSLEGKLDEARATLKAKESRVSELEAILKSGKSHNGESENTKELLRENFGEMETELEGLFKQKIEAEVEYLSIVRTIQNLRIAAADHIALFEEQKALAGKQAHMLNKLEEAESKAVTLKKQAEVLETCCGEILETEEVVKLQNRVFKVTKCFSLQLVMLVVFFWLFALQLSPHSGVVVPT